VVIVCESHVDRGSPCQFSGVSMKIRHVTKPKIVKSLNHKRSRLHICKHLFRSYSFILI
jgi:hypothetical protein